MGIMEKKMETTITGDIGFRVLGLPRPSNVVPFGFGMFFWVWTLVVELPKKYYIGGFG